MRYLAQTLNAIYRGDLPLWIGPSASNLRGVSTALASGVWVWEIDGETVAAIPGTSTPAELRSQAFGYLFPANLGIGQANAFYAAMADAVFAALPNSVDVIVGHSMGGAIATLVGRRFVQAGLAAPAVFAFGAPRPVTANLAAGGGWSPIVSLVNEFDPVPLILPNLGVGPQWGTPPGSEWLLSPTSLIQRAQPAGTITNLAVIAAAVADQWHAAATYIGLLRGMPPAAIFSTGDVGMKTLFEFTAIAEINGQEHINRLHYYSIEGAPEEPLNVLATMRRVWNTMVLPWLNQRFVMKWYGVQKDPAIRLRPTEEPGAYTPLLRWGESVWATAIATEIGGNGNGAMLPTHVAVNIEKICGPWRQNDAGETLIPAAKRPRGSFRISGINELVTADAGNLLTDAFASQMTVAASSMREVRNVQSAIQYRMVVITMAPDGSPIIDPGPPVSATICWAPVNNTRVNPYISSQNSRKQRNQGA